MYLSNGPGLLLFPSHGGLALKVQWLSVESQLTLRSVEQFWEGPRIVVSLTTGQVPAFLVTRQVILVGFPEDSWKDA